MRDSFKMWKWKMEKRGKKQKKKKQVVCKSN